MKHLRLLALLAVCMLLIPSCKDEKLKVLYWNIQNGMWSDQGNNYDNFVDWVKSYDPDVCIWAEARTIYHTGEKTKMPDDQIYLPDGWEELAKRYGHQYWSIGGYRDKYPQVITSKYPIETVNRIVGDKPDSVVTHGAGHFKINVKNHDINLVALHTWPQKYAYKVAEPDREANKAANGGDYYRLMEMTYICEHTIGKAQDPVNEWWLMAGDFNSQSVVDNDTYNYEPEDTRLLVHDYILNNTSYKDVIHEKYPDEFKTSIAGHSRIDFVYCSPAMMEHVTYADIINDDWTGNIVKDDKTSFRHPSDHRPIMLEVILK